MQIDIASIIRQYFQYLSLLRVNIASKIGPLKIADISKKVKMTKRNSPYSFFSVHLAMLVGGGGGGGGGGVGERDKR